MPAAIFYCEIEVSVPKIIAEAEDIVMLLHLSNHRAHIGICDIVGAGSGVDVEIVSAHALHFD